MHYFKINIFTFVLLIVFIDLYLDLSKPYHESFMTLTKHLFPHPVQHSYTTMRCSAAPVTVFTLHLGQNSY